MSISNTTYRAFVEKLGASDPTQFVGDKGELFWDPNNEHGLSLSDGKTPGGIGIKAPSISLSTRFQDTYQWLSVWDRLQSVNANDVYANAVTTDVDGNIYVVGGRSNDNFPVVAKFYDDGEYDWIKVYLNDDTNKTYMSGDGIALSPDGQYIYALFSSKFSNEQQIAVVQLDTSGYVIRSMEIDRTSYQEQGAEIVVDSEGYVYVIGTVNSEGNGRDIFVTKLSPTLQEQWARVYDKNGNWQRGEGIVVDETGIYITGRAAEDTVFVAKLSKEDGTFVWQREYINSVENYDWAAGFGIAVSNTSVYVTGKAYNPSSGSRNLFLLKLDKDGTVKWQRRMAYGGFTEGLSIVTDAFDNVYLSGYADYPLNFNSEALRFNQVVIAKFDADGNNVWQKAFGGKNYAFDIPGSDNANVANSGQGFGHHSINLNGEFLYICGATYAPFVEYQRAFLLKITADGDNSGVYGDWIVQDSSLTVNSDEQFLLVGNNTVATTTTENIDFIRTNSSSHLYDDGGDSDYFRYSNRSPFELNAPNGTITAAVGRFRDQISIGDWPIKVNGWNRSLYIGDQAGSNDTGAWNNIVIGQYAGQYNTNGSSNIFLGRGAGQDNTIGYGNVFLGRNSGNTNITGSNNVAIGHDVNLDDNNGSNQLKIGSNGDWWLKGDTARSVYIRTNLVFDSNGTQIVMKDSAGGKWAVGIGTDGLLTTTPVA